MGGIWFFNLGILSSLVGIIWWRKGWKITTGLTILTYRVITFITTYFWGNTVWWHQVSRDNWNHYQIGIVILVFLKLASRLGWKSGELKTTLAGMGIGMIVDEISDLMKLIVGSRLPYHRDSVMDLAVIAITYAIVLIISQEVTKRREKPTSLIK